MKTMIFSLRAHLLLFFLIAAKASGENPCVVRADRNTVQAIIISMSEPDDLFAAVDQYSSGILAGDWRAIYGQWSPLFQHEISQDEFVKHMVSSKYDVTVYNVKRCVVEDNVARLVVRISDSEGAPRYGIALWGKDREGRWRCIDDGTQFIRTPRILFGKEELAHEMYEPPSDSKSLPSPEDK